MTKTKLQASSYTLANAVMNLFLFAMFAVFPLFVSVYPDGRFPFLHFDNAFFDIRHQKFYFFAVLALVAVTAEVLLLLTKSSEEFKNRSLKELFMPMSFTDWSAVALVLSCALSTVLSPHPELAFLGEYNGVGRNNGLLLILIYVLLYFVLSRLYRCRDYIFIGLAVSCSLVSLLTVLNGFYIDPLNTLAQFRESQPGVYMEFFSTIGNKNMLASFLCVTLPVSAVMAVVNETLWKRCVCLVATGLGTMAMIIGDSDSALLGTAVFFAVFLVVFSRSVARLKRFFLMLDVMLLSVGLLRLFSEAMGNHYKELGALPKALLFSGKIYIVLALCAVVTALLYLLDFKKPDITLSKAVPVVLGVLFSLTALGGLGVFFWFSVVDTQTPLGDMEKLLRMNDAWGTHRGIMWLRSFRIFAEANPWQKLFGTGPDTFYYAFEPYFKELEQYGNSSTDAAHNEYINYLITIGAVGLLSYLAFAGSALVRGFKAAKRSPVVLCCCAAMVAYLAQATVNIALPISTPLFIIFLTLCEAFARQAASQ
ncbi:MAG: O-antigen ligase family protein [Ruminococcus sp.]|nr:O-antigen ligase family protein [Ruminococcus sp.]